MRIDPKKMKRLRTENGMTQADLAKATGIAESTISRIESSGEEPRISTAKKIADALGIKIADFVVWEDEDQREPT